MSETSTLIGYGDRTIGREELEVLTLEYHSMQNTPEIARRMIGLVLDVQAHCVVPLLIGLA